MSPTYPSSQDRTSVARVEGAPSVASLVLGGAGRDDASAVLFLRSQFQNSHQATRRPLEQPSPSTTPPPPQPASSPQAPPLKRRPLKRHKHPPRVVANSFGDCQTPTPVADVQHELLPTQPIATAVAPSAAYLQRPEHPQLLHTDVRQGVERLRGPAARVVTNMEASLDVPTATSVRTVPAKLLMDNRVVMNNHLARTRGGKVSFTHLIGYAIVETLAEHPGDERGVHDGGWQARHHDPGTRQLWPRDRPPQARRPAAAAGAQHQGRGRHGLRAVLGGVRRRREVTRARARSSHPISKARRSP